MTMQDPGSPQHPPRADSYSDATLFDVARSVDGLVVLTRAGMRRALLGNWIAVALLALGLAGVGWMLARSYAQAARLEAVAAQIELVAAEQSQAKAATEKVAEKVDEAKATEASKPSIEIAPATTATPGTKAKGAVLVIKPARPKPSASTVASGLPPAPQIEIPIKLPAEATAVPAGTDPAPPVTPKKR